MKNRSKNGQFRVGTHWRPARKFWNKAWLRREYVVKKISASDLATQFKVKKCTIFHWLKKHGIESRSPKEAAAVSKKNHLKGKSGRKNPMWNRRGPLCPNWQGGGYQTRERYSKIAARGVARAAQFTNVIKRGVVAAKRKKVNGKVWPFTFTISSASKLRRNGQKCRILFCSAFIATGSYTRRRMFPDFFGQPRLYSPATRFV